MAKEIKVNLDILDSTKRAYDDAIETLETALNELSTTIEELRSQKWKSNGADTFFQNYDGEWKKSLNDHLSYLKHLRDCLAKAQTSFREKYEAKM